MASVISKLWEEKNMKKIISIFVITVLSIGLFTVSSFAATPKIVLSQKKSGNTVSAYVSYSGPKITGMKGKCTVFVEVCATTSKGKTITSQTSPARFFNYQKTFKATTSKKIKIGSYSVKGVGKGLKKRIKIYSSLAGKNYVKGSNGKWKHILCNQSSSLLIYKSPDLK